MRRIHTARVVAIPHGNVADSTYVLYTQHRQHTSIFSMNVLAVLPEWNQVMNTDSFDSYVFLVFHKHSDVNLNIFKENSSPPAVVDMFDSC